MPRGPDGPPVACPAIARFDLPCPGTGEPSVARRHRLLMTRPHPIEARQMRSGFAVPTGEPRVARLIPLRHSDAMTTAQFAHETPAGEFVRQANRFTNRITADSDSAPGEGPDALGRWPVESDRYRLVWSRACPWAHRARIVWGVLGLTEVISLATVDPIRDDAGWRFTLDPEGQDPVLGIKYLSEAYRA